MCCGWMTLNNMWWKRVCRLNQIYFYLRFQPNGNNLFCLVCRGNDIMNMRRKMTGAMQQNQNKRKREKERKILRFIFLMPIKSQLCSLSELIFCGFSFHFSSRNFMRVTQNLRYAYKGCFFSIENNENAFRNIANMKNNFWYFFLKINLSNLALISIQAIYRFNKSICY